MKRSGASAAAFTALFGPPSSERIERVKTVLQATLAEIGVMKGRPISCPEVTQEGVIASRGVSSNHYRFYPPFFRRDCEDRLARNCGVIDKSKSAKLFRRITAIHEASHVRIMGPTGDGRPTRQSHPPYADTGLLRVLPFIAVDAKGGPKRLDAIENPDGIAIYSATTGGAEPGGLAGVLAASGDTHDDRASDSVPEAQRGPLVAVVRLARAIAVSGLEQLKLIEKAGGADSYSAHMPDYGRALFAQCEAALEVFKLSFVVGGAAKDAPPNALVIAAPGRLKGLAPKMSPATLTALADAMILEILMAHGELFVGRPPIVLKAPRKPPGEGNRAVLIKFVEQIRDLSTEGVVP